MHPGTSTGKGSGMIRHHLTVSSDNPQHGGFVGALSAAKASSYGFHTRPFRGEHCPAASRSATIRSAGTKYRLPFMTAARAAGRTITLAAIADVALVLVFVLIGRGSHDEGFSFLGTLDTLWPFLAGLVIGWLAARAWRRPTIVLRAGVPVWIATVAFGMLFRVISGQGIAVSFVIVAAVVLGIFLLGWRAIVALVARARRIRTPGSTA
jgi:hypothetical protein